jgi:hypothetical protein
VVVWSSGVTRASLRFTLVAGAPRPRSLALGGCSMPLGFFGIRSGDDMVDETRRRRYGPEPLAPHGQAEPYGFDPA